MSEETPTPGVETPAAPPSPGTAEYNAQLAAEGQVAMGAVPDKFKQEDGTVNMEAFAKSYVELEKRMHQTAAEPAAPEAESVQETPAETAAPEAPVDELRVPDAPEPEAKEEAPQALVSQEDLTRFTSEIMRSGDVTTESRAALLERGIPETLIDNMVEGQRAKMRDQYTRASDIVGSQDRLSKIFGWAANNLDDGQRASVNAGLASSASEATLLGLAAMFDKSQSDAPTATKAAEPREAPRYAANAAGREVVSGFGSKAEYYTATADPAKMADPKYRMSVEQRMIKTDWANLG